MEQKLSVTHASCGSSHTAVILGGKHVATFGRGEDGQLGHGNADNQLQPVILSTLEECTLDSVAAGAEYVIAYSKTENTIWSWGWGDFGRLGQGDASDLFIPKQIKSLCGIPLRLVACGDAHTMVITMSGEVYSFGRNQNGQLGTGCRIDSFTPQKIAALEGHNMISISCGAEHTAAASSEGKVFSWGWGRYGNLGLGDSEDRDSPKEVTHLSGKKIVTVACGWRHTCAVSSSGELYTYGWSKYGQLGHGDNEVSDKPKLVEALANTAIKQVSGGWRHTLVLDMKGNVYGWGWNQYGQLGSGTNQDENKPTLVSAFEDEEVTFIACGWRHSVAITANGDFYSWGRGVHGQLGHPSAVDRDKPEKVCSLCASNLDVAKLKSKVKIEATFIPATDRYALVPDNIVLEESAKKQRTQ